MSTALGPRPKDPSTRYVWRLLVLVGTGGALICVLALAVGGAYFRQWRHQANFRRTIVVADEEWQEREQLQERARALLLAGDFDALDAMIRDLRSSRAVLPCGLSKLAVLYQGFAVTPESWDDSQWTRAIAQAGRWMQERPDSIAARLVNVDLLISYAWIPRKGAGAEGAYDPLYLARIEQATAVMKDARLVAEKCPRRFATMMRLGLAAPGVSPRDVKDAFVQGVAEDPEFPTTYAQYFRYLHPSWRGAPGELPRAVAELGRQPGGPEKVARVVWAFEEWNSFYTDMAPWPLVRQGFADMSARHPESLDVKSAACLFAGYYGDRPETQRCFGAIGSRMSPTVWRNEEKFARAHRWATFEQGEVAGGDPLARFFSWVMRS